jgi:DNA-binding GntR family transcriptional regulator
VWCWLRDGGLCDKVLRVATPKKSPSSSQPNKAETGGREPELSSLLMPKNGTMMAVEQALLRGEGGHASPPIAEQIAARLAGVIALNLLRPGQRLFENDISEILHVSRSPVREAIRILERDRLVELSARRGATVTAPDAHELRDIFEVRAALFSILLDQVMMERPDELKAMFDSYLPRLTKASVESPEAYLVETFQFNLAIADLCSNRLVVDQLKAMSLRTLRYVRVALESSPTAVTRALKSWRELHAAVAKGDKALVIETAKKRIGSIRDMSVAAVRQAQPAESNGRTRG